VIERRGAPCEHCHPGSHGAQSRKWLNQFDQGFVKYTIPYISTLEKNVKTKKTGRPVRPDEQIVADWEKPPPLAPKGSGRGG